MFWKPCLPERPVPALVLASLCFMGEWGLRSATVDRVEGACQATHGGFHGVDHNTTATGDSKQWRTCSLQPSSTPTQVKLRSPMPKDKCRCRCGAPTTRCESNPWVTRCSPLFLVRIRCSTSSWCRQPSIEEVVVQSNAEVSGALTMASVAQLDRMAVKSPVVTVETTGDLLQNSGQVHLQMSQQGGISPVYAALRPIACCWWLTCA